MTVRMVPYYNTYPPAELIFFRYMGWDNTYLPNSAVQSPSWEADSHSSGREIPRLLWDPKVHYRVHKARHWN